MSDLVNIQTKVALPLDNVAEIEKTTPNLTQDSKEEKLIMQMKIDSLESQLNYKTTGILMTPMVYKIISERANRCEVAETALADFNKDLLQNTSKTQKEIQTLTLENLSLKEYVTSLKKHIQTLDSEKHAEVVPILHYEDLKKKYNELTGQFLDLKSNSVPVKDFADLQQTFNDVKYFHAQKIEQLVKDKNELCKEMLEAVASKAWHQLAVEKLTTLHKQAEDDSAAWRIERDFYAKQVSEIRSAIELASCGNFAK